MTPIRRSAPTREEWGRCHNCERNQLIAAIVVGNLITAIIVGIAVLLLTA